MNTRLYAAIVAALAVTGYSTASFADSDSVSWKRIIGIIQANNVVSGINGGGQPWSTLGGEARVGLRTAHVEFEVRGLVLADGNTIGTPGAISQVKGIIVCGSGAVVDTPLVPLNAQGDTEFDDIVPGLSGCTPVTFLIRIAADRWIANGAVRSP